jgi:hypothetical protein
MLRTFNYIRPVKSDLWNAIYAVLGGEGFTQSDMNAMIWYPFGRFASCFTV